MFPAATATIDLQVPVDIEFKLKASSMYVVLRLKHNNQEHLCIASRKGPLLTEGSSLRKKIWAPFFEEYCEPEIADIAEVIIRAKDIDELFGQFETLEAAIECYEAQQFVLVEVEVEALDLPPGPEIKF